MSGCMTARTNVDGAFLRSASGRVVKRASRPYQPQQSLKPPPLTPSKAKLFMIA